MKLYQFLETRKTEANQVDSINNYEHVNHQ